MAPFLRALGSGAHSGKRLSWPKNTRRPLDIGTVPEFARSTDPECEIAPQLATNTPVEGATYRSLGLDQRASLNDLRVGARRLDCPADVDRQVVNRFTNPCFDPLAHVVSTAH